jgi:methionyl-tRNA formyltransferase
VNGTLVPRPQPEDGVSYAAKVEKSEARIEWNSSAAVLDRQIRAFNPWPIAETRFAHETLRVLGAVVTDARAREGAPGTVLGLTDDGLRVACGEGVLALREVQRAGKRPVSARDFVNAVRLQGLRFDT